MKHRKPTVTLPPVQQYPHLPVSLTPVVVKTFCRAPWEALGGLGVAGAAYVVLSVVVAHVAVDDGLGRLGCLVGATHLRVVDGDGPAFRTEGSKEASSNIQNRLQRLSQRVVK